MRTTLGVISNNTVFIMNGAVWKKTFVAWTNPQEGESDSFKPEIRGKPSSECVPKLGGKFQDGLKEFFPDSTKVEIT